MGYIGSVMLLLFNLSMVMMPEAYGIEGTEGEAAIRPCVILFVSVGIWWLGFSQVSFFIFYPKGIGTTKKSNPLHFLEWFQRIA